MFKNDFVSIIVPVYNVEQYIDKCIESILNQTYSNIEIILIDDGSTDKSNNICDFFVKKDNRVKCIHKTNEGVSKARQTGIANSSGDWVLFVDSDDEIPCNALEYLIQIVKKYPYTDIAIGGYQYIPKSKFQQYYSNECFSGEELIIKYLRGLIHTGPVAKLLRKNIVKIEDFELPSIIKMGEDTIMNIRIAQRARNVVVTNKIVYLYYIRSTSVCQTFFWTLSYSRYYEKILYSSLNKGFKQKYANIILFNKLKRRISVLKSFVKKTSRILNPLFSKA